MRRPRTGRTGPGGGFAFVAALTFMLVLASLGVAICLAAVSGLKQAENHSRIHAAQLQAESGVDFTTNLLGRAELSLSATGQEVLDAVAEHAAACLNGCAALQGLAVQYDQAVIRIPPMLSGPDGERFALAMWMADPERLRLRVTGEFRGVRRAIEMDYAAVGGHPVFGFGIASKGPICMENLIQVTGANHAGEAKLLSMAPGQAFRLLGSLNLQGDVYASHPAATVAVSGTGTIGGVSMTDPNMWDHIHIGEGFAEFPQIDTSKFEAFATSIVDKSVVTNGTRNFKNIRIKANTNPTFSGTININGVVFVEVPNQVTFGAGTTITGVICTQVGTPGPANVLKFEQGTVCFGTDALPDTETYRDLRKMTGSFILAPGFRVKFENESGVINGIIAAHHVKFENSFNGTLRGGIICYGTEEIMAENLSAFTIDHSKYTDVPAGFVVDERKLVPMSQSYAEPFTPSAGQ